MVDTADVMDVKKMSWLDCEALLADLEFYFSLRKHTYVILTPLNPTFI